MLLLLDFAAGGANHSVLGENRNMSYVTYWW
jgi:hypothetical protein